MILRLSAKLAKKLRETPTQSLPLDPNPFADWSAHLFTAGRTQHILITNTASLYSVVMHGKGITDATVFLRQALNCIRETLQEEGQEFLFERLIAPYIDRVLISKALNRQVTGSMNELARKTHKKRLSGVVM
jgi:predicted YcjX-like family ATPase